MATKSDADKLLKIESMYEKIRRQFVGVGECTVEELRRMQAEGSVVLVDVRTEAEQAESMIPGAITAQQFEANPQDHEGKTVVAYCTIGGRSGMYASDLGSRGWNVFNLKGAILAWTHCGGELVNADGPTRKVHVHGRKFSLCADGYEPVW